MQEGGAALWTGQRRQGAATQGLGLGGKAAAAMWVQREARRCDAGGEVKLQGGAGFADCALELRTAVQRRPRWIRWVMRWRGLSGRAWALGGKQRQRRHGPRLVIAMAVG